MRHATRAESPDRGRGVMLRRSIMIAALMAAGDASGCGMDAAVHFRRLLHNVRVSRICREAGAAARSGSCVGTNQRLPDEEWAEAGCP